MLKILHAAFMVQAPSGILNQMLYEQGSTSALGLPMDSKLLVSKEFESNEFLGVLETLDTGESSNPLVRWVKQRRSYVKWLLEHSQSYDVMLLRWNVSDPFYSEFIRKSKIPVMTVHHTFEGNELLINAKYGRVRSSIDSALFRRTSNSTIGIVGVTDEIVNYEKSRSNSSLPSHIYPNGILYGDNDTYGPDIGNNRIPRFIFVASHFSPWQGLDLLLDSVLGSQNEFELHVVGAIPSELRKIIIHDRRVHLHGALGRKELSIVYAYCDIGLSAFALHRKGMMQACSLKVRDYLRYGLPVYSSHDDIFPESFPYYRNGKPCIENIIQYFDEMVGIKRRDIASTARPFIDKTLLVKDLYEWMKITI